jgi:signal transduction histidine kinase
MDTTYTEDVVSTLLPQDIEINNQRLIFTRWMAVATLFIATFASVRLLNLALYEPALYGLGAVILVYNAILTYALHAEHTHAENLRRLVVLQVILDWLAMSVFLHLTGGVISPAIVFFVLHVIMVTILLPGQSPYLYVVGVMTMVTAIVYLEANGSLPHYPILEIIPTTLHESLSFIITRLGFFGVALFATAYITASIMKPLRQREKQLVALFSTTHSVSSSLDKTEVLEHLTTNVRSALHALGVTVRLLERDGVSLRLVASSGAGYRSDEVIEASRGSVYQQVLDGHIRFLDDKKSASDVLPGTVKQVILVPMRGKYARGIISIYQTKASTPNAYLARFLQAIAYEGLVAIEHALAHEALQNAEKQRTQFVHIVTHELRAPVVGSQSMLRVLLANMGGKISDQQRDILERLNRRMDALLALINDLLSLAEATARDQQVQLEPINLNDAVQDAAETFRYSSTDKHQVLEVIVPDVCVSTMATPNGIKRVLENLIGNAIKYTPENGSVTVRLMAEADNAIIEVQDTGIGIPEEALAKLGEEFYRAPNARESSILGTGLGMATVKQLIDNFNGRMDVESTVNVGTTFRVTLALHSQAEQAEPA